MEKEGRKNERKKKERKIALGILRHKRREAVECRTATHLKMYNT